jgi:hypothetical protein
MPLSVREAFTTAPPDMTIERDAYVPVENGYSYEQVREFVRRVGKMIEKADTVRVTMAWKVESMP